MARYEAQNNLFVCSVRGCGAVLRGLGALFDCSEAHAVCLKHAGVKCCTVCGENALCVERDMSARSEQEIASLLIGSSAADVQSATMKAKELYKRNAARQLQLARAEELKAKLSIMARIEQRDKFRRMAEAELKDQRMQMAELDKEMAEYTRVHEQLVQQEREVAESKAALLRQIASGRQARRGASR